MREASRKPEDVAILIPAYGGADKLDVCLKSLEAFAPANSPVYVLDDGTPDKSVEDCCRRSFLPNLTYVRSDLNRGFVETCNWGWRDTAPSGADILLLNSDTEATAGFLEEMLRVLYLHERHAVVTPRSNNATIFSIPGGSPEISPLEAYRIWREVADSLPEYSVMPTAVGFCMLVKAVILDRFGLFDPAYSPGYNEENDFVCRINRYGYSAVAANRAFVFHYESSTFGPRRKQLDQEHRKLLVSRYPEYDRKVAEYFESEVHPVERFSILKHSHRPTILFDLFHLPAKHSGTSEFALCLLRELYRIIQDEFELFVGLSSEGSFFASELNGYRIFEDRPTADLLFDLAFKPSQIFTWSEFRRLNRLAPRISFVLQDVIAVRCDYLTSSDRKTIFRKTSELADRVYTISDFTYRDSKAFFGSDFPRHVVHHGTDCGTTSGEFMQGNYVFVMGNSFAHKGVNDAVARLKNVGAVVVLGGDGTVEEPLANVQRLTSGKLTRGQMRELMSKAGVVVYPSYYEGYGLPVVDALALGKDVIALDTEINRELAQSLQNPKFSLLRSFRDLEPEVKRRLQANAGIAPSPTRIRRWKDVAMEYAAGIRELLAADYDVNKLNARHELFRLLASAQHP